MKKVSREKSTIKSNSTVYFWEHLAKMRSNIWLTTVVVLAIVVVVLLVVTLPGNGLRSEASGFGTSVLTMNGSKQRDANTLATGIPVVPGSGTVSVGSGSSGTGSGQIAPGGVHPPGLTTQPPVTSPPVAAGSPGVSAPVASSHWPVWSIETINWNYPQAPNGIGIKLKKGGKVLAGDAGLIAWPRTVNNPNGTVSTFGGYLRNNGYFNWVVSPTLAPGNDYQIQVLDWWNHVLGESPMFSITAADTTVHMAEPAPNSTYHMGDDVEMEWNPPRFAGHAKFWVYKKSETYNGLAYSAEGHTPADIYVLPNGNGDYIWTVSNNLGSQANGNGPYIVPGDELELIISDTDNPAHSAHVPIKIVQ